MILAIYEQVGRGIVRNYLNKLYESMPWRMKVVMEAREGHTKYQGNQGGRGNEFALI